MDILYRTLITPSVDVLEFSVQNRKYRSRLHHRTRIFKQNYMWNVINRIICDFLIDWCYDMLCASMRLTWETPVFICYVIIWLMIWKLIYWFPWICDYATWFMSTGFFWIMLSEYACLILTLPCITGQSIHIWISLSIRSQQGCALV